MNEMTITRLAKACRRAGLDKVGAEALILELSPQQRRLFLHLTEYGQADTITLRSQCSLGNISETASALNAKLEAAGHARRVVCRLTKHRNQFGETGQLGVWSLVEVRADAAA